MQDGLLGALQALHRPLDQVLAAGRQDLQPDVVGDHARGVDELLCEVEVGVSRCREGDFDLFVAELGEHFEVGPLLVAVHGVDEGLVAIAEISGQPAGRLLDGFVGPLAVGEVDGLEGLVFGGGIREPCGDCEYYVEYIGVICRLT